MNNQHVIEKAVFDISFGSEEEAFEQHASLGTFVRGRLMAVVNEIFDELSADGQVVRIEALEVDLGDVLYHGYPEEMENRLRERLRSVLREKLMIPGEKQVAGEGVITRDISEMEQLTHFLTKGHLPWYAHPEKDGTIDQMLRRVLRSKGREFAEFLKSASRKDRIIKRLACQFPDAMLSDIVHLIEPTERGFINEIVSRPEVFQQACGESSEDAGGTKRKLWEFTLSYLLVERGSIFNKKAYLGSMIRQMAAHDNMRYMDLLASLTEGMRNVEAPGTLKREMLQFLGELSAESGERKHTAGDVHAQSDESTLADELYERIILKLNHRGMQGESADKGLAQIFCELARENPRMLLLLYQRFSMEELRQLIRAFLTVSRQADTDFISDFIGALETFADKVGSRKSYYWQVLERLVRNEVLDFELLIRENMSPDEEGGDDKAPRGIEHRGIDPETPGVRTKEQSLSSPGGQSVEKPLPETEVREMEFSHITKALEEEDREFTEEIYIENAGLVLAAPYLPRLFAMLELTEESAFKNRKAAERAVHLLQFMVNESTDSPEYQLVLNKILCGVRTGIPIAREIDMSNREKDTIEGLIRGMIENWKIIGNTSVQGFRESFLQREGRLGLKDDTWHLLVEQRAFDMLLDQIPWSFSIIKHPWMDRVVYVTWR